MYQLSKFYNKKWPCYVVGSAVWWHKDWWTNPYLGGTPVVTLLWGLSGGALHEKLVGDIWEINKYVKPLFELRIKGQDIFQYNEV